MRHQNTMGTYKLPYTAKSERKSIVILIIFGTLISLPVLSILERGPTATLPVIIFLCLLWSSIGVLMLNVVSQKIVLLPDRVIYRTLFSKRETPFRDITYVARESTMRRGYRGSQSIQYILRIEDRFSSNSLLINTKPFSKRNLSIIIDAIATHAPSVTLDESVRQLREGTFTG